MKLSLTIFESYMQLLKLNEQKRVFQKQLSEHERLYG